MSCNCNPESLRGFPGHISFTAYLSQPSDRQSPVPFEWTERQLVACMECGEISSRVPDDLLWQLRKGAGE